VVVGGGAIGCEFASLLADLGVSVTLIESATSILSGCDADVAKVIHRSFVKRGITIVTDVAVTASEATDDVVQVHLSSDTTIEAELIVVAVGRTSEVRGIGDGVPLERTDSGAVVVAEHQQTSLPGVYAIGDVVAGRPQLAHVGFAEAQVAVGHALGEPLPEVNNDAVPWAIYCRPEVAFVGLTEAQAIDRGYTVVTKREPLGGNSRAQIIGETEGLVKVVCAANADGSAGEILGVHLVGPWATEQLGHAELAVNLGLSVREVAKFLAPHPSLSEHYGETLLALSGRGMHVRG
jgi:dihydrolipoamide dehydrogenase